MLSRKDKEEVQEIRKAILEIMEKEPPSMENLTLRIAPLLERLMKLDPYEARLVLVEVGIHSGLTLGAMGGLARKAGDQELLEEWMEGYADTLDMIYARDRPLTMRERRLLLDLHAILLLKAHVEKDVRAFLEHMDHFLQMADKKIPVRTLEEGRILVEAIEAMTSYTLELEDFFTVKRLLSLQRNLLKTLSARYPEEDLSFEWARLKLEEGVLLFHFEGDSEEAERALQEALEMLDLPDVRSVDIFEIFEKHDPYRLHLEALVRLGEIYLAEEMWDRMQEVMDQAYEVAMRIGERFDPYLGMDVYWLRALALAYGRRFHEAKEMLREGKKLAAWFVRKDPHLPKPRIYRAWLELTAAQVYHVEGDEGEALRAALRAARALEKHFRDHPMAIRGYLTARIARIRIYQRLRGDRRKARKEYEESLRALLPRVLELGEWYHSFEEMVDGYRELANEMNLSIPEDLEKLLQAFDQMRKRAVRPT